MRLLFLGKCKMKGQHKHCCYGVTGLLAAKTEHVMYSVASCCLLKVISYFTIVSEL